MAAGLTEAQTADGKVTDVRVRHVMSAHFLFWAVPRELLFASRCSFPLF